MITRSNLAEQLREYQVRSSHEWAIVSFFTSSRLQRSNRGDMGGRDTRAMGAVDVRFHRFLGGGFVFPVHKSCSSLGISYFTYARGHESNKTSKKEQEDEEKNAPSFVNVKL
ncbi:hypothetical protein ZIOFF_034539 [Zingiber officinale]|uniref:Uncharacterized protein n=1 Tax=Zingiber officinale TaxID=94328 RepID=A0A8J5GS80_ZINOF|nr:hypothetical protein ZIOFF_034539 [Zingiber officinale]